MQAEEEKTNSNSVIFASNILATNRLMNWDNSVPKTSPTASDIHPTINVSKNKINEIFLALELEKNFTKEEILEYYLNIIYFGDNSYGIESASKHYFSKNAKELTLDEACTLAGMIKSPNYYSPVSNPDRCKARRNLVLK